MRGVHTRHSLYWRCIRADPDKLRWTPRPACGAKVVNERGIERCVLHRPAPLGRAQSVAVAQRSRILCCERSRKQRPAEHGPRRSDEACELLGAAHQVEV